MDSTVNTDMSIICIILMNWVEKNPREKNKWRLTFSSAEQLFLWFWITHIKMIFKEETQSNQGNVCPLIRCSVWRSWLPLGLNDKASACSAFFTSEKHTVIPVHWSRGFSTLAHRNNSLRVSTQALHVWQHLIGQIKHLIPFSSVIIWSWVKQPTGGCGISFSGDIQGPTCESLFVLFKPPNTMQCV